MGIFDEYLPYSIPRSDKVSPDLMDRFGELSQDFYGQTGEPLRVTDSFRTYAEQAAAHARKPTLAVSAGKSRHETGAALDIDQEQIAKYGVENWKELVTRHGFAMPALSKGEHYHIELPRFEKAGKIAATTGGMFDEFLQESPGKPGGMFDEFMDQSGQQITSEFAPQDTGISDYLKHKPLSPDPNTRGDMAVGAGKSLIKLAMETFGFGIAEPIAKGVAKALSPADKRAEIDKTAQEMKTKILGDLTYTPQTNFEKGVNFIPEVVGSVLPYIATGGLARAAGIKGIPGALATFAGAELPKAYGEGGLPAVVKQLPWTAGMGLGFGGVHKYIPGFVSQGAAITGLAAGQSALHQQIAKGEVDPLEVAKAAGTMALLHGTGLPGYLKQRKFAKSVAEADSALGIPPPPENISDLTNKLDAIRKQYEIDKTSPEQRKPTPSPEEVKVEVERLKEEYAQGNEVPIISESLPLNVIEKLRKGEKLSPKQDVVLKDKIFIALVGIRSYPESVAWEQYGFVPVQDKAPYIGLQTPRTMATGNIPEPPPGGEILGPVQGPVMPPTVPIIPIEGIGTLAQFAASKPTLKRVKAGKDGLPRYDYTRPDGEVVTIYTNPGELRAKAIENAYQYEVDRLAQPPPIAPIPDVKPEAKVAPEVPREAVTPAPEVIRPPGKVTPTPTIAAPEKVQQAGAGEVALEVQAGKSEILFDRVDKFRSATLGKVHDAESKTSYVMSVRPDNSAEGYSVVLKGDKGSQSFRMNYRGDMPLDAMIKDFQDYLDIDNPGRFKIELGEAKVKSQPKEVVVKPQDPPQIAEWKEQLAKYKRMRTGPAEKMVPVMERRINADPSKWKEGDGVGWKVAGQTNRGFAIDTIDPESKMALIKQVADTELTSTGGDYDRIKPKWVPLGDLVRDNKYNLKSAPTPPKAGEGKGGELYSGIPVHKIGKALKDVFVGQDLPDIDTLKQQGRDYVAEGKTSSEAIAQLSKDYRRTPKQMYEILEGKTPAGKVPVPAGQKEEQAPTPEVSNRIIKQRMLTLEKPAFDEIFTSRKEARGYYEQEGIDPTNYIIKKNKDKNFQIHEKVPRVPLYEDMANIARNLAEGKDLDRKFMGAKADTYSLEPSIGTFQRLERVAPGITEKLWYKAKQLENQAYQRYEDFKDQLSPYTKGLSWGSSRRIAAWATAQQEAGPETLRSMGVKMQPLNAKEQLLYDFGRKVYDETLPEINAARILAGKQPIPKREDYAPFMRQYLDLLQSGGDPITVTAEYFHPTATPFKYAKERKWNITPLRLDFVKDLKDYMGTAYKHIEYSPFVSTVREMVNKITMPDGTEVSLRDQSPYTAQYLTKWADRIAGKQETFAGPLIDKTLIGVANNIGVATLSGLGTSAIKQPTSIPLGWAGIAHQVGYTKATRYVLAALQDSVKPSFWRQAMNESNVLPTREMDVTWKESITEAHSLVGDLLGKLSPKLQGASEIITGIKKGLANLGYKPLGFLDMHAAMVTWGAAKRAGLGMGMGRNDAIRFADTRVIRTQASGSPIDRAPIQANPLGKFMSVFQTFVMNDFDFIKKEVLGVHGPKDISSSEAAKRILMFASAGALVNILYRDVLGGNAPMPEPIAAGYKKYMKTGNIGETALESAKEMTQIVPLIGGLRYGGGVLGAGPQFVNDLFRTVAGKWDAPSPLKTAGKLLGIPGTEQMSKIARTNEGKMTLMENFFGRQSGQEKPKKDKERGGFGGFGKSSGFGKF